MGQDGADGTQDGTHMGQVDTPLYIILGCFISCKTFCVFVAKRNPNRTGQDMGKDGILSHPVPCFSIGCGGVL